MIKNKYFLLLIFLIIFAFLGTHFVFALEVPLPGLSADPTFPEYVIYFFKFGMSVAGVLSLISFTIGAVGLIASMDNPETASNAKSRMKSAVLGLILTVSAYIIVNTINPELISPILPPLEEVNIPTPPQPGVYFYLTGDCSGDNSGAITTSQDEIANPFGGNIKSVKIINDAAENLTYGTILHNEVGLTNGGQCEYPITSTSCSSVSIPVYAADIFLINNNGDSGNGVNFYSKPTGWDTNNAGHKAAGFYEVSNDKINPMIDQNPTEMCFGYKNVDVPDAYKYKCSSSNCGGSGSDCQDDSDCATDEYCDILPGDSSGICVATSGGGTTPGVDCSSSACETFADCPGSIEIKGSYLVGIFSEDLLFGDVYCQTFTQTVPNLGVQEIVASGSESIGTIYMIATQ